MNKNIHTGRDSGYARSELSSMLNKIPIVTRWVIGAIILQTIVIRLEILPAEKTYYHFALSAKKLQIWRPVTACFPLPPSSAMALMDLYTIYSRSADLERRRNTLDYLFYMWFCISALAALAAAFFGLRSYVNLETSFKFFLSYTWSVDNANARVVYFGLFPILAKYIPIMELFLAFLFNENFIAPLMGLMVAYVFQCLDTTSLGPIYGSIRHIHGYGFSPTGHFGMPKIVKNIFATRNNSFRQPGAPTTASARSARPVRHEFPGKGRRLGD